MNTQKLVLVVLPLVYILFEFIDRYLYSFGRGMEERLVLMGIGIFGLLFFLHGAVGLRQKKIVIFIRGASEQKTGQKVYFWSWLYMAVGLIVIFVAAYLLVQGFIL